MKTITLKSGVTIPVLGLGTDNISDAIFKSTIQDACELDYQLFDTATAYNNHMQLAETLKTQNEIHPVICTKINNGDINQHQNVERLIEHVLQELDLSYIDYLLLHNPSISNYVGTFEKLIRLKEKDVIKSLGVSNFTVNHLTKLEDVIEHVDINQVELHPLLTQHELVTFCRKHKITIMAYRPFGCASSELLEDKTLISIADKYNKSVPQIILRWLIQQEHCTIPKANEKSHLQQNIDVFNFNLTDMDMINITSLNRNMRTCTGPWADFDD